MIVCIRFRRWTAVIMLLMCLAPVLLYLGYQQDVHAVEKKYIHWAEFNVPYDALERSYECDVETQGKISWIDILAVLAAKYGGEWQQYKSKDLDQLVKQAKTQEIQTIGKKMKYYSYFRQVYQAVLGEFLGNYMEQAEKDGQTVWKATYGLKVFSPIAGGYWYEDYDDFGASRSYGYQRKHLGHDMMGSLGTPIVAVESGTVEVLGWNPYGGWRVGIRSFDRKRYYYYAHLRKDHPFQSDLYEGKTVTAGDVIGYMGRTGYSTKENINNIKTTHLHYGLELVFDESQKESNNEIWIDLYSITKLLQKHKSAVIKVEKQKEYVRKYEFIDETNNGVIN